MDKTIADIIGSLSEYERPYREDASFAHFVNYINGIEDRSTLFTLKQSSPPKESRGNTIRSAYNDEFIGGE